jgi:hypothetical protein
MTDRILQETIDRLEGRVSDHTFRSLEPGKTSEAELIDLLAADPVWKAAREREEAERQRRDEEWRAAEQPLVMDLRAAGVDVESAWDLVNTAEPYPDALPILVEHLPRPYPDRVREGIARALAVRDARFAWDTLRDLYDAEQAGTDAKHGLAVALSAAADDTVIDDVITLAREDRHGDSRILLLNALERSNAPHAAATLEELASDPTFEQELARRRRRRRKHDR